MITPRSMNRRSANGCDLYEILANLTLLYIKAKNFHWNVSGPEFYGLHKTFDGIQEDALEWADTIGERMRSLDISVDASAGSYLKCAWFPEGSFKFNAGEMKQDMTKTLECISKNLMETISSNKLDEVTLNILQDLCATIDKHKYFVKSSI